jgi:hypothetical protein
LFGFITETTPQHYNFLMTHDGKKHYSPPVMSGWQHQGAFVVRFNAATNAHAHLFEGHVEHVASGARAHFSSLEEMLEFMTEALKDLTKTKLSLEKGRLT